MTLKRPLRKTKAFEREFARFQKNYGTVVKRLRFKAKLSRRELARRAQISVSTLIYVEKGQANSTLARMDNLATALNTRLSQMFQMAQEMKP